MKKERKLGIAFAAIVVLFSILTLARVPPPPVPTAKALLAPDNAKVTYDARCAKCHGTNGRGRTLRGKLDHARDFTDAGWQNNVSDERLFNSISNGRNKMPAFKKKLSEQQIDDLVTYVRRFKR